MKLNKEQIQRIFLGAMLTIGLIYAFFEFLITPLGTALKGATKTLVTLQPKLQEARAQIAKVAALEKEGPESKKVITQILAMIPEGSPIAWFPPRITEFMNSRGITQVMTRMNNESAEKNLQGFRRLNWGIEIQDADFSLFAPAVADFENSEPLSEIHSISIEAGRENVGKQRVLLNINNLVRL